MNQADALIKIAEIEATGYKYTDWEAEFIKSIQEKKLSLGHDLSEKQGAVLIKIHTKAHEVKQ